MKHEDKIPGGLADQKKPRDFSSAQLEKGITVEIEHTKDPAVALEIAMDHLVEDKNYYDKLEKIEKHAFWRGFKKGKISGFLRSKNREGYSAKTLANTSAMKTLRKKGL